jgi:hypothetical protein
MAVEGVRQIAPPDGLAGVVVDPALVAYLANRAELSPLRTYASTWLSKRGRERRVSSTRSEHEKQERACRRLHRAEC